MSQPTTIDLDAALAQIPDGYYAVPCPNDPALMTYWRRTTTSTTNALTRWPAKAAYGPRPPRRSEMPDDRAEWKAILDAWSDRATAYHQRILTAVLADPAAAARRFADLRTKCSQCGRPLRDAESKLYAVGPDCRGAMDPAWLAQIRTAEVGRAHAALTAVSEETIR
ncbi:hypothetical protein KV557_10115 [Kitasatospora aureofaciens]|uniref:DUF6011 domain-containing protein n=1 Tax=Kitasatospora aureofaciens TaxID=1894 RepID=UPI001C47627D|nr:DUF6011 domain-containing protein [Kitasatospora aureofaciens]MBV6697479.1 hypothetical protein [Kitasatospora aureofaciens]